MAHGHYFLVLVFIALCAFGVNFGFRLKFSQLWRPFIATDAIVLATYSLWDLWAVRHRNWYFDPRQILGLKIFGLLPIEEILFFVIVPLMTILSYLALSKLLPRFAIEQNDSAKL